MAKAEAHLKQWRNTDVLVPDPVRQQLDLSLQSGLSFELRGVRALEAAAAAQTTRRGCRVSRPPRSSSARAFRWRRATPCSAARCGTSWPPRWCSRAMSGGRCERSKKSCALAPQDGPDETAAKAHYSLGVLMASAGRGDEAIRHFSAAVKFNPNYLEARQGLADALSRAGRPQPALAEYAEIVRLNPRAADARFGYAMALVRLRRYARSPRLAGGSDPPAARRAAAPPRAGPPAGGRARRHGPQRLPGPGASPRALLETERRPRWARRWRWRTPRSATFRRPPPCSAACSTPPSQAGLTADVRRMQANLRLYERGQACRTPWQSNDTVFSPGPPVDAELAALLPPSRRPAGS